MISLQPENLTIMDGDLFTQFIPSQRPGSSVSACLCVLCEPNSLIGDFQVLPNLENVILFYTRFINSRLTISIFQKYNLILVPSPRKRADSIHPLLGPWSQRGSHYLNILQSRFHPVIYERDFDRMDQPANPARQRFSQGFSRPPNRIFGRSTRSSQGAYRIFGVLAN